MVHKHNNKFYLSISIANKLLDSMRGVEYDKHTKYYNLLESLPLEDTTFLIENEQLVDTIKECDRIIYHNFSKNNIEEFEFNGVEIPYVEIEEEFYNAINKFPHIVDKDFININNIIEHCIDLTLDFEPNPKNILTYYNTGNVSIARNLISQMKLEFNSSQEFLEYFEKFPNIDKTFITTNMRISFAKLMGISFHNCSTEFVLNAIKTKALETKRALKEDFINKVRQLPATESNKKSSKELKLKCKEHSDGRVTLYLKKNGKKERKIICEFVDKKEYHDFLDKLKIK